MLFFLDIHETRIDEEVLAIPDFIRPQRHACKNAKEESHAESIKPLMK